MGATFTVQSIVDIKSKLKKLTTSCGMAFECLTLKMEMDGGGSVEVSLFANQEEGQAKLAIIDEALRSDDLAKEVVEQ